jgi:hypothetical protein
VKGGAFARAQLFQPAVLSDAASSIGVPELHPHELRKMDPDCAAGPHRWAVLTRHSSVYGGATAAGSPWLGARTWLLCERQELLVTDALFSRGGTDRFRHADIRSFSGVHRRESIRRSGIG